METINERIKMVFEESALSQSDFARKLNVTPAYVWKLLNKNESIPSDRLIDDMCQKFNINKSWLCDGNGKMHCQISPANLAYNHFGYLMENSTPQKKAVLSALVELAFSVPDDKWDYIIKQFQDCLEEAQKIKGAD